MSNAVALFDPEGARGGGTSTGEVDREALEETLGKLFDSGLAEMELLSRLALGRAREGEDYSWLPGQRGYNGKELYEDNPSKHILKHVCR